MGTLLMRQASSYLQEKYRAAKLAFTDVCEAEMLTEKVTDNNVSIPDTKTMTQIAGASYDFDDYWKIVDVLHKRFHNVDWKKWRQSYNSLVLLEFLMTHGPEDLIMEFRRHVDTIKELGTFRHVDKDGINWGIYMKNRTERILQFMQGGPVFQEMRLKAIKLTNEIQGFGSSSSSSPSSPSTPPGSWRSSFDSFSPTSQACLDITEAKLFGNQGKQNLEKVIIQVSSKEIFEYKFPKTLISDELVIDDAFDWSSFSEIDLNDEKDEKQVGFLLGICSKYTGYSPLRSYDENPVHFPNISQEG